MQILNLHKRNLIKQTRAKMLFIYSNKFLWTHPFRCDHRNDFNKSFHAETS